jgi:hypothetical protein
MNVKAKALLKITAHSGVNRRLWPGIPSECRSDGGASDRCVKVWDLELSQYEEG